MSHTTKTLQLAHGPVDFRSRTFRGAIMGNHWAHQPAPGWLYTLTLHELPGRNLRSLDPRDRAPRELWILRAIRNVGTDEVETVREIRSASLAGLERQARARTAM